MTNKINSNQFSFKKRCPTVPPNDVWFLKYLQNNLLKVISVSVFVLTMLPLVVYFFHIEYTPIFDLQLVGSLFLSLGFSLGTILISFSLLYLAPYLAIGMFISKKPHRHTEKYIVSWVLFATVASTVLNVAMISSSLLDWSVAYAIGFYAATLALIILFAITKPAKRKNTNPSSSSLEMRKQRVKRLWQRKGSRSLWITQFVGMCMVGFLQLYPLYLLFIMLGKASNVKADDYSAFIIMAFWFALLPAIVGGTILLMLFSTEHRRKLIYGLPLLIALPVVLSAFARAPMMFPMKFVSLTKIGNFRAESMAISEKSCHKFSWSVGIKCDEKNPRPIELCNVHVISRIGSETYLFVAESSIDSKGSRRIAKILIPTADIEATEIDFNTNFYNLEKIEDDLKKRGALCIPKSVTLSGNALFDSDGSTLNDAGKDQLTPMVQALKASPLAVKEVLIVSHADARDLNTPIDDLGAKRVDSIKQYMEYQFKDSRIGAKIRTESTNTSNAIIKTCGSAKNKIGCKVRNRRIEIVVIPEERVPEPKTSS